MKFFYDKYIKFQQLIIIIFVKFFFCGSKKDISATNDQRKILVLKVGGLGDFLFGLKSFYLLRENKKNSKITLLTQSALSSRGLQDKEKYNGNTPEWVKLVENIFDEIILLPKINIQNILEFRKTRTLDYDDVIYLSNPGERFGRIIKKLILLRALGFKNSNIYGWRQNFSTGLMRKYHSKWGYSTHKSNGPTQTIIEYLEDEYLVNETKYYYLKLPKLNLKSISSITEEQQNILKSKYIVICPGSSQEWKNWGRENYREILSILSKSIYSNFTSLVFCGPEIDYVLAKTLSNTCNDKIKCINLCGKLSLMEIAQVMQNSKLVLTTDGGLAHLAAYSDATLLSLSNGGEEPGVVTPVGEKVHELRFLSKCTPCFGMDHCPLNTSECVRNIKPAQVYKEIVRLL